MKKTTFKKVIAIIMAVVTCLGAFCIPSFAALPGGDIVSPQNIAIGATSNELVLGSGGRLSCYGATSVQNGYTAKVTVELQRLDSSWTTIKTWTHKGGSFAMVDYEDYYVVAGDNAYRLKLTHEAYSGSTLIETIYKYSPVVYY